MSVSGVLGDLGKSNLLKSFKYQLFGFLSKSSTWVLAVKKKKILFK